MRFQRHPNLLSVVITSRETLYLQRNEAIQVTVGHHQGLCRQLSAREFCLRDSALKRQRTKGLPIEDWNQT
jgi:hypothetical protein